MLVRNQLILAQTGMGFRPIDLDAKAVIDVINLYQIEDRRATFEKVLFLGRHFIGLMQENE